MFVLVGGVPGVSLPCLLFAFVCSHPRASTGFNQYLYYSCQEPGTCSAQIPSRGSSALSDLRLNGVSTVTALAGHLVQRCSVRLPLACCTHEEHAFVSACFCSQKSGALCALPWRGLSLCRETCAALASGALPHAASGDGCSPRLLEVGNGAEISAWKFGAPGAVKAG